MRHACWRRPAHHLEEPVEAVRTAAAVAAGEVDRTAAVAGAARIDLAVAVDRTGPAAADRTAAQEEVPTAQRIRH